ncbi:MAG: S41 family peptidase [Clostridiales bacterium]|jgi:hypothetical protein|nr:S41 family peptidase [Clostridiales bacterium]
MKKVLFLLMVLFLFSGCGSDDGIEPRRAEVGEELVREHFLYDINHFEYVLENNFGLLDVVRYHHGVDFRGKLSDIRNEILNAHPDFNIDDFNQLFSNVFSEFTNEFPDYMSVLSPFYQAFGYHNNLPFPFAHFNISLSYTDMSVLLSEFAPLFYGEDELFEEFLRYYSSAPCSMSFAERFIRQYLDVPPIVNTSIIEQGYIAYLSIASFPRFDSIFETLGADIQKISSFLYEVQDFEHLIIDLRDNPGGHLDYFIDNIVQPLINEPKYATAFYFTPHGEYARRFTGDVNRLINQSFLHPVANIPIDRGIRPTGEILEQNYMPEIRIEDFYRLPYGFRAQTLVAPSFDSCGQSH